MNNFKTQVMILGLAIGAAACATGPEPREDVVARMNAVCPSVSTETICSCMAKSVAGTETRESMAYEQLVLLTDTMEETAAEKQESGEWVYLNDRLKERVNEDTMSRLSACTPATK